MLKQIPKATKGTGNNQYKKTAEISPHVDFSKPKSQVIKENGLTQRQAEHFQIMADNPDSVARAKEKARCIVELERIAGIRQGSANEKGNNRIGDRTQFQHETQADLAEKLSF